MRGDICAPVFRRFDSRAKFKEREAGFVELIRAGKTDEARQQLVSDILPLHEVSETSVFGSKAVGLGQAVRDGLPVPPGVALSGAMATPLP